MTTLHEFEVPATSANLGPGFGVLGLALALPLRIAVREGDEPGHVVEHVGATAEPTIDARHDAVLRGLHRGADALDVKLPPDLVIEATSSIPAGCGLGSNTAGFAAGLATAARFAKSLPPPAQVLDLLVALGGDAAHGAAALIGGLAAAVQVDEPPASERRYRVVELPLHESWRFVFVCPDLRISTADGKRILPPTLPHAVVPRTAGRVVGLLRALGRGEPDDLASYLRDEVHVPFRRQLVPGMDQAMAAATAAGAAGVTISGHGPGVIALAIGEERTAAIAEAMSAAFSADEQRVTTLILRACEHGALPT